MEPIEIAGLAAAGTLGWALGRRGRRAGEGERARPGESFVRIGTRLSGRAAAGVLVVGQQAVRLTARGVGVTGKAVAVGVGGAAELAASLGGAATRLTHIRGARRPPAPAAEPAEAGPEGGPPPRPAPARPRARRATTRPTTKST
jgi:hypothetical protein